MTIGAATFLNGTLVLRFGMRRLIGWSLIVYTLTPLVYALLFQDGENPPVWILMLFLGLQFFSVGFLFGNLRSMAMEPLGHIAGIGAAITGFMATLMSVPISAWIGSFIKDSAFPLFLGFPGCGTLALLLMGYSTFRHRKT